MIFSLIGSIFRLIGKLMIKLAKGTQWYLMNLSIITKDFSKKNKKILVSKKEEIF